MIKRIYIREDLSHIIKDKNLIKQEIELILQSPYNSINISISDFMIDLFKTWLDNNESELTEEEIENIKEVLNDWYSSPDDNLNIINKYDGDFKDNFIDEVYYKLIEELEVFDLNFPTRVYRDMTIPKQHQNDYIDKLKKGDFSVKDYWTDGVGIYWATDKNKAEAHWGHDGGNKSIYVQLEAEVLDKDVDWLGTIRVFLTGLWEDEAELRLKKNQKIKIKSITFTDISKKIDTDFYVSTGHNENIINKR